MSGYLTDVEVVKDSFDGSRFIKVNKSGNRNDEPMVLVTLGSNFYHETMYLNADALEKVARRFLNEAARIRGDKNPLIIRQFDEVI